MKWTVKDLIEELQCYEGHKNVWITVDGKYAPMDSVDLEELRDDEDIVIR